MVVPNITIVTAFYDIGRSKWEGFIGGHPLPSYLKRTNEYYFQCFERMLKLDNDIVVFTSPDLVDKFKPYQRQKPNLCVMSFDLQRYSYLMEEIRLIQNDPKFFGPIRQPYNPEYWSPEYVLVNFLKSEFVGTAIDFDNVMTDLVAWVDFGYCRDDNTVPTNQWSYNFDPNKIHFFSVKKFVPPHMNLREIINTNDVFIQGCHIVASKDGWLTLEEETKNVLSHLLKKKLIDDDQTMLYMCYVRNPDSYEIHYLDETKGWFQIFQEFNNAKVTDETSSVSNTTSL